MNDQTNEAKVDALVLDGSWNSEITEPTERREAARQQLLAEYYQVETYTPSEINEYGDVADVKSGWMKIPKKHSRGAPLRHTIVESWEESFRYSKPVKSAVVPVKWWEEKQAKADTPKPKHPLSA